MFYFRVGASPTLAYQHSGADQGRQSVFFCFTPRYVSHNYTCNAMSHCIFYLSLYVQLVFTVTELYLICDIAAHYINDQIKVVNSTTICLDLDLAVLITE